MKSTVAIILMMLSSNLLYSQSKNQIYLVSGDTVHRVIVSFSPDKRNMAAVVDSLSRNLTDGKWCVITTTDTIGCRCIFTLQNGLIEGQLKEFDDVGNGEYVKHFKQGKAHGFFIYWSNNGRLQSLAVLKNGKLNGTRMSFNERGHVQNVSYWRDGSLIDTKKYIIPRRSKSLLKIFNVEDIAGDNLLRLAKEP